MLLRSGRCPLTGPVCRLTGTGREGGGQGQAGSAAASLGLGNLGGSEGEKPDLPLVVFFAGIEGSGHKFFEQVFRHLPINFSGTSSSQPKVPCYRLSPLLNPSYPSFPFLPLLAFSHRSRPLSPFVALSSPSCPLLCASYPFLPLPASPVLHSVEPSGRRGPESIVSGPDSHRGRRLFCCEEIERLRGMAPERTHPPDNRVVTNSSSKRGPPCEVSPVPAQRLPLWVLTVPTPTFLVGHLSGCSCSGPV